MKEKIYTIPVNEAVNAETECPFCFIEHKIEKDAIEFVLGSSASYMEKDIRATTDEQGFCRAHFKQMNEYGNSLGNAWILKTHYGNKMEKLRRAFEETKQREVKKKFAISKKIEGENKIRAFVEKEGQSCYVCEQIKRNYERYLETFLYMYDRDEEFRKKIHESKGFCLSHFGDLCDIADRKMKVDKLSVFYEEMEILMLENLERIQEDVAWLIEKYDYRNKDADWKNSRDAIPRGMQKLKGGQQA